jgi:hypothetical protein
MSLSKQSNQNSFDLISKDVAPRYKRNILRTINTEGVEYLKIWQA